MKDKLSNKEDFLKIIKDNIDKNKYAKGIPHILDGLGVEYHMEFLGIGKDDNQNAIYVVEKDVQLHSENY